MMKLLMLSGDIDLARGNQGPFYYMLQEFSKYWSRIDIICPRVNQTVNIVHGNVYIHSSKYHLIWQPLFILKKGLELWREQKHNLVTIHSYPPFYNDLGAWLLKLKIKIPFVLEIMHITGYPRSADFKEKFYRLLNRIIIPLEAKRVDIIRVINAIQVPEYLVKIGVPKNKIKYIPAFYIDLQTFKPDPLMDKKYDLVFCSRLVKNKGIINLIKAIKIVAQDLPAIKLIIIGSGPLRKKIDQFIKQNNLENNILFSGWLPGIEDVADVYNQSQVFVMPSLNEGGPRVTLEAMACGIPVITTRVGVMLDIIKDGENGLFTDWASEDIAKKIIKLLIVKPESQRPIGQAGLETVQIFERKNMIKNYAETYQKLIR